MPIRRAPGITLRGVNITEDLLVGMNVHEDEGDSFGRIYYRRLDQRVACRGEVHSGALVR